MPSIQKNNIITPTLLAAMMGLCGVGQVQAQGATPDAGSILQGIERERKPAASAVTAPA